MILAPSTTNRYQRVQSLDQVSRLGSLTDYGALKAMEQSFGMGFQNNFSMMLGSALKRRLLDDDEDPRVTEEYFYSTPAARLGLDFDPTENSAQLDYRIYKAANLARANEYISGRKRTVRNFASAFAGTMVDPLVFAPISIPTRAGKLGQLHRAAGNRAAAAFHTARGTFKNVLMVNAAYEVPYAIAMNDLNVQKYTFDHLELSTAMNLGFAGLIGGVHGYVANRAALKNQHILKQDAEFTKAFETESFIDQLRQVDPTDNFIVSQMLDRFPVLKDWANGRTDSPLTPQENYYAAA